jgi:hypothetical protein
VGAQRWRSKAFRALALGAATFGLHANLTILSQFDDIAVGGLVDELSEIQGTFTTWGVPYQTSNIFLT